MAQVLYFEERFLQDFLSVISKSYSLFVTQAKDKDFTLVPFSQTSQAVFSAYRALEPLKMLLTPLKERLDNPKSSEEKPLAIFSAKNCDLNALTVQDFIYLGQTPKFVKDKRTGPALLEDTLYKERRDKLLLISADCTNFKEVCWCLGVGLKPYPETGFDINLSYIDDGFVVELVTQKGELALAGFKNRLVGATVHQLNRRERKRSQLVHNMEAVLTEMHPAPVEAMQQAVKNSFESSCWKEFMLTCVECGGCNFICDTCHCFLLADERRSKADIRLKLWDACLYANFAKVAGGANPLDTRAKRLRNRYLKKFDFFPDNMGKIACCGCGRCIEVCPAKIDIRKVLKILYSELSIKK
jgi:ferredoxin